ncbi:hypothetical protein IF650_06205 [Cellulosimicrobium terreum]|nr:hypothetical protein [Cellulosimicrobium terreum]
MTSTTPPQCRAGTPYLVADARARLAGCADDASRAAADLRGDDLAWSGPAAEGYRDALAARCFDLGTALLGIDRAVRQLDTFSLLAEQHAAEQAASASGGAAT